MSGSKLVSHWGKREEPGIRACCFDCGTLTFTGGRSGLILDPVVEQGKPAEATLAVRMIEGQVEIYAESRSEPPSTAGMRRRRT